MKFKHLLYFKRVAELEHITNAANDLYISQAHLSRIIAELESELGVDLFDRNGRGIKLNANGLTLYQNVLKIINLMNDTKRQVQATSQRHSSELTVVTNASAYMPNLLMALSKIDPTLKIGQYSAPREDILRMLREGTVDCAICCPPIDNDSDLKSIVLRVEPAVIIYPEHHWLSEYTVISLKKLKNEAFISVAQGFGARDAVDGIYNEIGFSPNFIIETGDTASVNLYVYEGLGVAVVAKALIKQDPFFKYHYTEIKEPASGTLALTCRRDRVFNENDNLFYQATLDYFRNLDDFLI